MREALEHDLARIEWEQRVLEQARAIRAGEGVTSAAEMDRILGLQDVAPDEGALDEIQ